ncbi:zinc-binding dehydrogenase [Acidiferrimicrobium sp. IK]|uniref:zinc-dependent alcohol dehydrogenase n=1 Tax=Acidiferrimicrobium sp. IK TaxID=2871700 RepID=UPI0021CB62A2|nr:zinc-binding dehydrogenase [Acidiferrimicrobium sp. IK]MCU4184570.1 zinc-binding dehydrogenase [Acidiferrimicrobium sp. IK]
MRALKVERSLARFGAARVASGWRPGAGGKVGPLRLAEMDLPDLPGPDWVRLRPRLSGICGSDLATVDGRSSQWFEPIVTFPFVPGHEIVADTEDGRRVVVEPVLGCVVRGIDPPCPACAAGHAHRCERLTGGHLSPGLQTGFCAEVGGGWSAALVAHPAQLHDVPDDWSDEAAVLVEPTACGVHGALAGPPGDDQVAVVIGAGTLGLTVIAALSRLRPDITRIIAVAKHPVQKEMATALGATTIAAPGELRRAVRRATGSWILDSGQLTGGAPLVIDCVGSADSLADALAVAAPGATIVMVGMPGGVHVDLTPLWQREIRLAGAYAYGPEPLAGGRHSFAVATDLVADAGLERLLTITYPLDRHAEAIAHAATAGRRGAVKVAFDLRSEKRR